MLTVEQEHLTLIKGLLMAFSTGDVEAVRNSMTDDVRFHFPGRNELSGDYKGKAEAIALLGRVNSWAGGTQRIKLHDVLANEQHGILMYTVSAIRGEKSVRYRYFDVYHFRDGQICEVWGTPADPETFDEFYSD